MGRRKLTRILLSASSASDVANAQNETPRDICVRKQLTEILEILDAPPALIQYGNGSHNKSGGGSGDGAHADQPDGRDRSTSNDDSRRKKAKRERSADEHKSRTDRGAKDTARAKSTPPAAVHNTNNPTPSIPTCPTAAAAAAAAAAAPHPSHWSPYGCHYFPDPATFPSPKLKTLPKEPLATGEQYYLDLAGNIRKGPVGVGNPCYCGPFFRHIEQRISANRQSLRRYVHRATERLDSRVQALATRTDDQIDQIERRLELEERQRDHHNVTRWLRRRGDWRRATTTTKAGGDTSEPAQPATSKSRKDATNANTLTRCRSLEELLDGGGRGELGAGNGAPDDLLGAAAALCGGGRGTTGMSRSIGQLLNRIISHRADVHANADDDDDVEEEEDVREENRLADSDDDDDEADNDKGDNRRRVYSLEPSDKEWRYHGSSNNSNSQHTGHSERQRSGDSASVARRLDELLNKTHEIIRLERSARRKADADASNAEESAAVAGGHLHVRKSSRHRSGGRTSSSSRHQRHLRTEIDAEESAAEMNASLQIAAEMEKITASLLGKCSVQPQQQQHRCLTGASSCNSSGNHRATRPADALQHMQSRSPAVALAAGSPEIAKEYISRKERRVAMEKERESSSMRSDDAASALSQRSVGSRMAQRHSGGAAVTRGYRSSSSHSHRSESHGALSAAAAFGTFYQNATFNDEAGHDEHDDDDDDDDMDDDDEDDDDEDNGEHDYEGIDGAEALTQKSDGDEPSELLSEMANIRQLNELKSRILNGAHWMRQQQQQRQHNADEDEPTVDQDAVNEDQHIEQSNGMAIDPMTSNIGKVRELVAMIQGGQNNEMTGTSHNYDDEDDDASVKDNNESREESVTKNTEAIVHRSINNNSIVDGLYSNETLNYSDYSVGTQQSTAKPPINLRPKPIVDTLPDVPSALPVTPVRSPIDAIEGGIDGSDVPPPIRFSSYPQQQQHTLNALQNAMPIPIQMPVPLLDTRSLIPKDAYFHELPNRPRPRPRPITATDSSISLDAVHSVGNNNASMQPETIFSADTQPIIGAHHQPQPAQQPATTLHHQLAEPMPTLLVSTQPIYYQSHHVLVQQPREKLLSHRRKFAASETTVLAAPMPAVRHMQPQPAQHYQPVHFPHHQSSAIPDTTASNDSGYSARISQTAASPSLSSGASIMADSPSELQRGGAASGTGDGVYEPYFLGSIIGASSLV